MKNQNESKIFQQIFDNISGGSRIFPGGGRQLPKCYYFSIFAENCMKMKEFGPPGGGARPWRPPLDPPMNMMNMGKKMNSAAKIHCKSYQI